MEKLGWPEVVEDDQGVYRFRAKDLILWAVDHGGVNLNSMCIAFQQGAFSLEEYMEFYRGLGYSLCGFIDIFGEHLWPEEEGE